MPGSCGGMLLACLNNSVAGRELKTATQGTGLFNRRAV